jgi:hypothetical protein
VTTHHDQPSVPRRRLLQGGAAAAGLWAVPVIQTVTSPAHAEGSPAPGSQDCRSQTFLVDRDLQPFVFEPFVLRWVELDLGVTFSSVSSLEVFLYESPVDPVAGSDVGNVILFDGPEGVGGLRFFGNDPRDPIRLAFDPDVRDFRPAVADGALSLRLGGIEGSFILTKVEVRVCGTLD